VGGRRVGAATRIGRVLAISRRLIHLSGLGLLLGENRIRAALPRSFLSDDWPDSGNDRIGGTSSASNKRHPRLDARRRTAGCASDFGRRNGYTDLMLLKLLIVIACIGPQTTLLGQSKAKKPPTRVPSIQNASFSLSLPVSRAASEKVFNLGVAERLFSLRTVSTSFTAEGSGIYTLYVTCSSPNFYSASQDSDGRAELVHSIPLYRHQASASSGKDRFSGLFSGVISCLANAPIRLKVQRDSGKDREALPIVITLSGVIEDIPTTTKP